MSATLVPLSACRNARRICSSVCPFFATFVSSSFSSRGPRLPLLTQLARGSLFGFWVNSLAASRLLCQTFGRERTRGCDRQNNVSVESQCDSLLVPLHWDVDTA